MKKNINKDKEIDLIRTTYREIALSFRDLRYNLYCNMFIINNPDLGYEFPYRGGGIFGGYLNADKEFIDKNKIMRPLQPGEKSLAAWKEELRKKYDVVDDVYKKIDIKDKKSFDRILELLAYIELTFEDAAKIDPDEDWLNDILGMSYRVNELMWNSLDVIQKHSELMGYWTAKMELRKSKRESGKGQKIAEAKRKQFLFDRLKKFFEDTDSAEFLIDKGVFVQMLSETFEGRENYPRHHITISSYRKSIEEKTGKRIKWQKGALVTRKDSNM